MISKIGNNYSFNLNGITGNLYCGIDYVLEYKNVETKFENLKELHLFVNYLTDIVENIDSPLKT
jgi:hypothetical protein